MRGIDQWYDLSCYNITSDKLATLCFCLQPFKVMSRDNFQLRF